MGDLPNSWDPTLFLLVFDSIEQHLLTEPWVARSQGLEFR